MPFKQSGKNLIEVQKDFEAFNSRFPKFVGKIAVDFFKQSFKSEGFSGDSGIDKWQKTKDTSRRTRKGKTLVKTGRLKRSIKVTKKRPGFVVVGTSLPYAIVHNEGLTVKATAKIGRHRRRAYTRKGAPIAASTVQAHKRNVHFKMPKRQFMGNSKIPNKRITSQTVKQITKLFT